MLFLQAESFPPFAWKKRILATLLIVFLAAIGYWLRIPLFVGVSLQLGSVPVLLALMLWRGWTGFLIGSVASLLTWNLWGHPWVALIFCCELLCLTLAVNLFAPSSSKVLRGEIVFWDLAYWFFVGTPLILFTYSQNNQIEFTNNLVAVLDLGLNGIINASLAFTLFLLVRLFFRSSSGHSKYQQVPLHGSIVAIILMAVAVPLLLLVISSSQQLERLVETGELDSLRIFAAKIARTPMERLQQDFDPDQSTAELRQFRRTDPQGRRFSSNPTLFNQIDQNYAPGNWSNMPDDLNLLILRGGNPALATWMDGFWKFEAYMDTSGRSIPALQHQSSLVEVVNPAKKKIVQLEIQIVRLYIVILALMVASLFFSHWIGGKIAAEFDAVLEPLDVHHSGRVDAMDSYQEIPRLRLSSISELGNLVDRINAQIKQLNLLNRAMREANRELMVSREELSRLSITDPMTNCLNRRTLQQRLGEAMEYCNNTVSPLALISFDIDHFKSINDQQGHQAGDLVLTQVVNTVRERLRRGDFFFRLGGDEFLIILPLCSEQDAMIIATELCRRVHQAEISAPQSTPQQRSLSVSISVGVGVYDPARDSVETLLDKLDRALYEAKTRGRNQVALCEENRS